MTKIAITADLHFRAKRLVDIKKGWNELIDHLINQGVEYLLVAGDVFESFNIAGREASFGTIYHAFKNGLDRFIGRGGRAVFIPGNHDIAGTNDLDALTPLNGLPGIRVVRSPIRIQLKDGIYIQCLPWLNLGPEDTKNNLLPPAHTDTGGVNILLGHCEVEGTVVKGDYSLFGGRFEFSKSAFAGKGYDHIALGHIHKRMDYYVGSPWHLSYGDAGSPTGFTMLIIENNKICAQEFVELFSSPRYHVYTDAVRDSHRDVDYVRVKYHGSPPDVGGVTASAIEMEKIPDQDSIQIRSDIALDATVEEMLRIWIAANNREGICVCVNELIKYIDDDVLCSYRQSQSAGSLQRIHNIALKHIGPHEDTNIAFNGEKFIAVSGHNGSGKSFVVDSLFAVPFGDLPSRRDSLMTHVTQGYEGESEMSIMFDSNGKTYCGQRILKNGKQKAYLNMLGADGEKSLIAGPKTTDYEREIYKLLGDKRLVLSSVFSAQGNKGDIVDASRTERKELLGNILGINGLAEISERAKLKLVQINAEIVAAVSMISQINTSEPEHNIKSRNQSIRQRQDRLLAFGMEAKDCLEKIKASEEDGKRCAAEKASIEAAMDMLKLVITEVSALQDRRQEALQNIKEKEAVVAGEADILEKLQAISKAKTEYEKYREIETINLKAKERQLLIDKDLQAQETVIGATEQRLLNDVEMLRHAATSTTERYETKIAKIDGDIKGLREKQQLLLRAGCKNNPLPCVFIEDSLKAQEVIQEKQAEQRTLVAQLNAFTERNSGKIGEIENQLKHNQYANEARLEIARLQHARSQIVFEDVSEDVHALKAVIASEDTAHTQLRHIQAARVLLGELNKKALECGNEIMKKLERQCALEEKAKGYDKITEEYNRLKADWKGYDQRRLDIYKQQTDVGGAIKALEGEIERFKEKIKDRELLEIKIKTNEEDRGNHVIIAEAFGRDGIQQLLIASALPHIQDILNGLLEELDNKFYITFKTEAETKAGKPIETLDILVSDNRGERGIECFSGGEQKLLRSVIRIALAIFQSQRSGSKYEVFVIDEAFDALDRDNQVKMLKILLKLGDRFNQIFVVSHTDDLLAEFPARINFKTINGASCHDFITN